MDKKAFDATEFAKEMSKDEKTFLLILATDPGFPLTNDPQHKSYGMKYHYTSHVAQSKGIKNSQPVLHKWTKAGLYCWDNSIDTGWLTERGIEVASIIQSNTLGI